MRAETEVQSDKGFWRHDSDVQCRLRSEHGERKLQSSGETESGSAGTQPNKGYLGLRCANGVSGPDRANAPKPSCFLGKSGLKALWQRTSWSSPYVASSPKVSQTSFFLTVFYPRFCEFALPTLIGFVWSGPLFFTHWTSEPCLQNPFFVFPSIARTSVSPRIPLMNLFSLFQ